MQVTVAPPAKLDFIRPDGRHEGCVSAMLTNSDLSIALRRQLFNRMGSCRARRHPHIDSIHAGFTLASPSVQSGADGVDG